MNKQKSFASTIIVLIIIFLIGGIFVLQYWWTPRGEVLEEVIESEEVIEDETDGWKVYRNEGYGFEIKYPENWKVARNIMSFEPDLVFCPPDLIDSDPGLGCQLKIDATKPQYENGMIYLFVNTIRPEHSKNPEYHHLGFGGEKDYDLFSDGVNEVIVNQMISTFRFIEKEGMEVTFDIQDIHLNSFDLENRTFQARNRADKTTINVIVNDSAELYSKGTWMVDGEWYREDFSIKEFFSILKNEGGGPQMHFIIKNGVFSDENTIIADEIFFRVQ